MIVHVPLIVFLLTNVYPSEAALFSRGSEPLVRAARHARRNVIKRSSGLWEDVRLAYAGLRLQQQPQVLETQSKLYCTNNVGTGFSGVGSGNGSGNSAGDGSDGSSGSSATSEPVAAPSSTSVSFSATNTASGPTSTGSSGNGTGSNPPSSSSSPWKVAESWQGDSFFDGWNFINSADIWTHGLVNYVDEQTARSANLIDINNAGNAIMRLETTPTVSGNRQAIRLESQYTYTGGLVILDAVHIPTGCGTWPAFWSNGPDWPQGGEIDMVEGVHDYSNNQVTLHTTANCMLPSSDPNALGISGTLTGSPDCEVMYPNNDGCGIRASQSNSFGAPFNSNGGGVFTMLWDDSGIQSWFFPRGSIPDDISDGKPQPSKWGTPVASFPASTCNPSTHFYNHVSIFTNTLCGDWAGAVWSAAGAPGQDQSCAQRTGVATCDEYIRANGGALADAYWEVKSVKIYQS